MERDFLELLASEAPVEDFQNPVRAARERDAPADEVERLAEAARLALQVRGVLAQRRRREAELAALNETAGDLVSLRDLELVLQAIVRRARRLLGTDTAYLTLIDPERGDTYMRVTEGTVTEDFGRLRLAFGVGLGGLVAQTRMPYATANYGADERFAHTTTIDSAVTAEHLVAILGVPLLLGDRVLGVLFAADRRERPFSPDQIALLSSLAAHAAVAIENARLFQEAGEAVRRLAEANTVIQAHSAAVERAAAAHERLTNIVLQGGGVEDLALAVSSLFESSIAVVDADGRIVAHGGPDTVAMPTGDPDLAETLAGARGDGRTARVEGDPAASARWVAPVVAGSQHLGALVLRFPFTPAASDLRALERAAQVTALLLLNQRSVAEAEQQVRGELLDDLLAAPIRDPDGLRRRAQLLSADLDRPHVVTVVRAEDVKRHRIQSVASALAAELGGLAGSRAGDVVLLCPGEDAEAITRTVARRLSGLLGATVTAGGAGAVAGPAAMADAYEEAHRCLRLLLALGRQGDTATSAELGVYGLLLGQADRPELERFVAGAIGPVLEYDRARGASLIATLEAYFAGGGNLTRTSQALHVHVNTLYQRLDRVAQLVGGDWQEPERALQLHLALTVHRLRQGLQ